MHSMTRNGQASHMPVIVHRAAPAQIADTNCTSRGMIRIIALVVTTSNVLARRVHISNSPRRRAIDGERRKT